MKGLGWLLGCAALLCLGAAARAETNQDLGQGWDLRAGFFIPQRGASRSAEGDLWLNVGAERAFYSTDRYNATISIDYYGSGRLYNIPIMINVRGNMNRVRYGAGAGIGISHDFDQGVTGVAYNFLVGYDLTQGDNPIFADLRYMGQTTGGDTLNGWSFTIGRRF